MWSVTILSFFLQDNKYIATASSVVNIIFKKNSKFPAYDELMIRLS